MTSVCGAVDEQARALVKVLASARTGASALPPFNPATSATHRRAGEGRLEKLCQQRVNLATQAIFERGLREQRDLEHSHSTEDELYDKMDELNQSLRQAYGQRRREAALVRSIHDSAVVTEAMYSEASETTTELRGKIQQRDELCSACLRLSDRYRDLTQELEMINADIRDTMLRNRQIYSDIQDLEQQLEAGTQEPPSQALDNERQKLENEYVKNAILRNTLQLLIVASGVDWAADENLLETMLSLDERPSFDS
ncbi:hypothetical protein PTSG_07066 [Salpingoeca rosetta]|uniref:Centromere protein H C-terminal domain-containing protein n=1 Tax=Salpingoeca rosetta (strain ATCC 50818 / BSB-021) TaxID=946362 RepID=F2UDY6_SALR5|nr:uncharacterized protein PTSG_07066 [Salpingoeca rosetta]EGD74836.1 hypothetical protein PTSG_07066 [Salpingoeca rosetta]|eukprot:XP_004992481.1 hypothetical protein PTSG_07066 [Salpingoeca rosetta]